MRTGWVQCTHWELPLAVVEAAIIWVLDVNSTFVVEQDDGRLEELRQHRGLPIGGCLSAGLVELFAMYMESVKL